MGSDDSLSAIKGSFSEYQNNYRLLIDKKEISFSTTYKDQFSKTFLLACASYFERKVTDCILGSLNTKECPLTKNFISKKSLDRQYHSLFDWNSKNANRFFSFFGDDFKNFINKKLEDNIELKNAIRDFIELGELRNTFVHSSYATFSLKLTAEDINKKFLNAHLFIEKIEGLFSEYRHENL